MKLLGNLFVASLLAVVTGAVVFYATRGETVEVDAKGKKTHAPFVKRDSNSARIYEQGGDRPRPSKQGPHPKLVCEKNLFEFGNMELGTERSYTFEIRNEGEADLVMKTGTPTCKCTQFELSKPVLKPGESGKIFLTWKPVSESPDFAQRAPVHTNDPNFFPEPFLLEIEGSVTKVVTIRPEEVWDLGVIADSQPTKFKGAVFSRLFDDFKLSDLKCSSPNVSTSIVPMDKEQLEREGGRSGYVVTLEVQPDVAVGRFSQELSFRVETEDAEATSARDPITLELTGRKYGPIEFVPTFGVRYEKAHSYVDLGEFYAAKGKEVKLLAFISCDEGTEFAVTDIEVNPSFLDVKMVEDKKFKIKNRKRYELIISVPPGSPRGTYEAKNSAQIVIRTNHPRGKEVKLRSGFVSI